MKPVEFAIAATHPSLSGHFPNHPVVPGVVVLERVIAAVEDAGDGRVVAVVRCKFVRPLLPDQCCSVSWTHNDGQVRFVCRHAGNTLAKGTLKVVDG